MDLQTMNRLHLIALPLVAAACGAQRTATNRPEPPGNEQPAGIETAPPATPPSPSGPAFELTVEQNGLEREITDHRVYLDRDTFTLVFTLADHDGLLVSASDTDAVYRAAAAATPIDALEPFGPGRAMAASAGNPEYRVVLSDEAVSYWYSAPDGHRFDHPCASRADGRLVCRRTVEYLSDADVATWPGESVYLVVIAAEWADKTFSRRIEQHRVFLELGFAP